ncbi:hypothetical protein L2E82_06075 [Cichorium intybus]|uniref:Uncharacterized protein n=1 Tax=Cichorium intybus TaxID=13427 RepID=A0ACB9H912_CICIN|nr:hypothetical protein L2E82_06075 [Cichorium intybus]
MALDLREVDCRHVVEVGIKKALGLSFPPPFLAAHAWEKLFSTTTDAPSSQYPTSSNNTWLLQLIQCWIRRY